MARTTIRTEDITASEVTTAKMATDPTNASNLSSGSVPLAQLGNVDTSGITSNKDDIALLAFKTQANGSLARYNLVDQSVDSFEDASGVDASGSTDEVRNASNYYSGVAVGSYTFTALTTAESSTWTVPTDITSVEALVVAGGGAGGQDGAGGGGAGGVVHHTALTTTPAGSISYTVGAGGTSAPWGGKIGTSGANSVFGSITSIGGGFGGAYTDDKDGADGGSGGGGSYSGSPGIGGTGTQGDSGGGTGYGNDGGNGGYWSRHFGGGGGGANAAGTTAVDGTAGSGGAGKLFSNFVAYGTDSSNVASTGSNGGYFGGGGGGSIDGAGTSGNAGVGGGGAGGDSGQNPVANTGGGGGATDGGTSGPGSVGFIGLRYRTEVAQDMTLISNAQTAQSAPTTGDLVITYTNGAGTATINTDLKAYISRNGSAYTSAVTLVSQGTTGGHTILTANGVDLSGITTGTSMRWKIETLNQSAAKETRIQAVSLGWS